MTTEPITLEIVAPVPHALDLYTAHEAAIRRRDELLTLARKGTKIANAESAKRAADILKEVATFNRSIEAARVAHTAPLLERQRHVMAIAKDLTADLDAEQRRIQSLIGSFTAEQERIATEARQKAWEEQERVRLENERKEREAREEAERIRREKEEEARKEQQRLQAKADAAKSEAARAKAEEARKIAEEKAAKERHEAELREREETIKRQQEAAAASAKAASAVVIQAPVKLAGVSTGTVLKFEVFDPLALYESHAAFCTIEPNLPAIRTALNSNPSLQLPGVRHWREAKATVRTN
jgi:hypothetical protein